MRVLVCMYQERTEDPNKVYINEEIRVPEVRCVGPEGENIGVLPTAQAIARAKEEGYDLIIISAKAVPPVAKIMDYGKFTYEQKKKVKEARSKAHVTETKSVQVKIGTGEHDKELKAERVDEWLLEGHRVKIDLFLWGRYKYMDGAFLTKRLESFLKMVVVPFKVADEIKKSPKGYSCTLELDRKHALPTPEDMQKKRAENRLLVKTKGLTEEVMETETP
jgi:translation initiation factor IF-3